MIPYAAFLNQAPRSSRRDFATSNAGVLGRFVCECGRHKPNNTSRMLNGVKLCVECFIETKIEGKL